MLYPIELRAQGACYLLDSQYHVFSSQRHFDIGRYSSVVSEPVDRLSPYRLWRHEISSHRSGADYGPAILEALTLDFGSRLKDSDAILRLMV